MTEAETREMLTFAAKAAGYTLKWGETYFIGDDEVDCTDLSYVVSGQPDEADWLWSPLDDDGDALRLAVKLGLNVHVIVADGTFVSRYAHEPVIAEKRGSDPDAATRLAITRAAAAIGREMP